MKRVKAAQAKKATAILAADLHIRVDIPICRTDDYLKAQFDKLNFIFELCQQNGCPLLIAGDVGNRSQWPNWLLEKVISMINEYTIDIIAIPGQHDLPEHRLDYWQKSGCGVLHEAKMMYIIINEPEGISGATIGLHPFPYGDQIVEKRKRNYPHRNIAMTHQMVIENKPLWPGQKAPRGHELLKKFPEYNLILSGDNHNSFIAKYKGRLLVNPGSMMRMRADQINHQPRVYKWFADTNEVEAVYLPIEQDVISRTHIETKQERDERMEAFVSRMTDEFEVGLSFENNLEEYLKANKIKIPVQNKVWEAVEA